MKMEFPECEGNISHFYSNIKTVEIYEKIDVYRKYFNGKHTGYIKEYLLDPIGKKLVINKYVL